MTASRQPPIPQRRHLAAFSFVSFALFNACAASAGADAIEQGAPVADAPACGAPATALGTLPRRIEPDAGALAVDIEGVVVADFQGGLDGVFLHSLPGQDDHDPATPEGAFVALDRTIEDVRVGQHLRVRGTWSPSTDARSGWSLTSVEQVLVCGQADPPEATRLSAAPEHWQALEGMPLHLPGPLVVTGNEGLLRWGELQVSFDGRLYAPTELHRPGDAAQSAQAGNAARTLVIDDGRNAEWPARLWQLPEAPGRTAPYRVGSMVSGLRGIVEFRHGSWRLQLTQEIGRVEQARRPPPPARDPASLRIASFNVLNYFNGDGRGAGFPTERGAQSGDALARQRAKLVSAMSALDADAIGLLEVENDGYADNSAIVEIARALTAATGNDWHALAAADHRLGSDVIAVGILHRSDRLQPDGPATTLIEGPFDDTSRAPLIQSFLPVGGGQGFVLAVNHFKSKGGCQDAGEADGDQGDGQACFNHARVDSARLLAQRLQRREPGIGNVLVLGDLNAHSQEDPVRQLREHGLVDLLAARGGNRPLHSYVFRGQAGRLDHALAGVALTERVRAAGIWHINADELPEFGYYAADDRGQALYAPDPYRSSDHDPVWVDIAP